MRAFAQLDAFGERARFSTWLVRIAINEALGRRRRRQPDVGLDVETIMDQTADPTAPIESAEVARLLERAIAALREPFRLVFVLRAVEQLSVREVAECLDVDEGTVKTRYFRARAALKGALAQHAEAIAPHLFAFHLQRCDRVVAHVLQRLPQ